MTYSIVALDAATGELGVAPGEHRAEPLVRTGERAGAAAAMDEARALAPDDDQITLWAALMLGGAGRIDEARRLFAEARRVEPRGGEHLRRFLAAGHLPAEVGPVLDLLEREPA